MATIILLVLAIAPCIAIAFFIFLKNTYKPSPPRLLMLSVFFGILSFGLAVVIGLLLHRIALIETESMIDQLIRAMVFVGFVEEGSKFLFLRGRVFYNKQFTQPFDGIVHAVMIGMGFAVAENLLYVYNDAGGSLIARMVTAVPAHAAFAVIMGYFVGEAKVFPSSGSLYNFMGLFFAAFAHGFYDYFLFVSSIPGLWWQSIVALVIILWMTYNAIKLQKEEEAVQ